MDETRIERDSMGEVRVARDALYGAQTQRALDNFRISGRPMPAAFIRALALVKAAAADANRQCDALEADVADALERAARSVAGGEHLDQFPVPVMQTGSGTSTNMNMNEVLATLASRSCGRPIHANDHANCSQSSNDVIPTVIQVSVAVGLQEHVSPALASLAGRIRARGRELADEVKTGRTHLMDAMPLTFGQELGAWATQLDECDGRIGDLMTRLRALPVGGSAVGTGINVPPGFPTALVKRLNALMAMDFTVSSNPYSRMAGQDVAVEASACLRALAVVLTKINNDLRWMSSGPLAGLGEIQLKPLQPGSSIMPGKVNPVLPEAALMAATQVMGNDVSVALAAQSGNFQLNVMLPMIADRLLDSIDLLTGACGATERTIADFTLDRERLARALAINPILVTALNSVIGYEAAATIAKRCYEEGRAVLDVAVEETGLPRKELATLLDPYRLTNAADQRDM